MKKLKKELQAIAKTLKGLTLKVEKIQQQVDKLDKPKAAKAKPVKKAPAKKVKKAPAKKAPAKKVVAKIAPAKKAPAKKVAAKKSATAVDTVLKVINRSKKGVDTAVLMKKTGFDQRKIHNIVYKLKKQGKVKSVGKGVYLKA